MLRKGQRRDAELVRGAEVDLVELAVNGNGGEVNHARQEDDRQPAVAEGAEHRGEAAHALRAALVGAHQGHEAELRVGAVGGAHERQTVAAGTGNEIKGGRVRGATAPGGQGRPGVRPARCALQRRRAPSSMASMSSEDVPGSQPCNAGHGRVSPQRHKAGTEDHKENRREVNSRKTASLCPSSILCSRFLPSLWPLVPALCLCGEILFPSQAAQTERNQTQQREGEGTRFRRPLRHRRRPGADPHVHRGHPAVVAGEHVSLPQIVYVCPSSVTRS